MKCYVHTLTGARIDSFPGTCSTARDGKLGKGLDCKRGEAGRGLGDEAKQAHVCDDT